MAFLGNDVAQTTENTRKAILPPHSIRRDFLPPELVGELLAYALANEERFVASGVGQHDTARIDSAMRRSSKLADLGRYKPLLRERLAPLAPGLTAELKTSPFEAAKIEVELVAHGDGAFYLPHLDTQQVAATDPRRVQRMLSRVYYFHAKPKAFGGGELRLHETIPKSPDGAFVDVEPLHNSLVSFPAWMRHEVRPVSVPSRRFADSRFAINIWFNRAV